MSTFIIEIDNDVLVADVDLSETTRQSAHHAALVDALQSAEVSATITPISDWIVERELAGRLIQVTNQRDDLLSFVKTQGISLEEVIPTLEEIEEERSKADGGQ